MKHLPTIETKEKEARLIETRLRTLEPLLEIAQEINPNSERARDLLGEVLVKREMVKFLRGE